MNLERDNFPLEKLEELGKGALRKAVKDGDMENGSIMAGQISGLIKKRQSAREIIEEIFFEYENIKNSL